MTGDKYIRANELAQELGIEITNVRAEREWLFISERVSDKTILERAITQLGNRKRFPLNVARALKVELPGESELPLLEPEQAKKRERNMQRVAELRKLSRRH
jgi:hypothetical protein